MIDLPVFRIDKGIPLPTYKTKGAIAFDLYCRENTCILPYAYEYIPLNVIVLVPDGYGLFLFPRSSLFKHMGLIVVNSVGLIDRDYSGPEDEIMLQVYSILNHLVTVKRKVRVAQALLLPVEPVNLLELNEPPTKKSRGGFGSTGNV